MSIIKFLEGDNEIKKKLGINIGMLRNKKGLTQEELADLVYVSPRTISQIENGKNFPHSIILYRIADALEVDYNNLMTLD